MLGCLRWGAAVCWSSGARLWWALELVLGEVEAWWQGAALPGSLPEAWPLCPRVRLRVRPRSFGWDFCRHSAKRPVTCRRADLGRS